MRYLKKLIFLTFLASLFGGCSRELSQEDRAKVEQLKTELESTQKDITDAEQQANLYKGGVIKLMADMRLEILKTNKALLGQRINSLESGAKISIQTSATKPEPERASELMSELEKQEKKVEESIKKVSETSGGLMGAMAQMSAATEANSLALLRQQYLVAKYGLALGKLNYKNDESPIPKLQE